MLQHLAAVNSISDVESFLCTNNTRAEENLRFLIESKYSEYESRGFVVPGSFLQRVIYYYCHKKMTCPFDNFVDSEVSKMGYDKPSLLIVPLHSFSYPINYKFWEPKHFDLIKGKDFFLFEKVGNKGRLIGILKEACKLWKLSNVPLKSEMNHFFHNDVYKWLLDNPILIMKGNIHSNDALENIYQWFRQHLFIIAKLYSRSVLDPERESFSPSCGSWDLWHLISISIQIDGRYHIVHIPQLSQIRLLMHWTNLNVVLDPNKELSDDVVKFESCLDDFYNRKCREDLLDKKNKNEIPKIKKMYDALKFYCKSFEMEDVCDTLVLEPENVIVFLQTAFETMLIDGFSPEKRNKMLERARFFLEKEDDDLINSLDKLIKARNDIIHNGVTQSLLVKDLASCRKLFLFLFVKIEEKIDEFDNSAEFLTHYLKKNERKNKFKKLIDKLGKKIPWIKKIKYLFHLV